MVNKIQLRRGTDAAREAVILDSGEPGWTTDTKDLYVGDGETPGGNLVRGVGAATLVVSASDSLHKERADYVCDGVDDQVEIQAAIDALPNGGGEVILLEGLYWINANINLKSNVTVSGQGYGTHLKNTDGSVVRKLFRANSKENIILEKMRIDNNRDGHGGSGLWGAGCVFFDYVQYSTVRDCWLEDSANENLEFSGGNHNSVINVRSTGCDSNAFSLDDEENNSVIIGCYAEGDYCGILISDSSECAIIGCEVVGGTLAAIQILANGALGNGTWRRNLISGCITEGRIDMKTLIDNHLEEIVIANNIVKNGEIVVDGTGGSVSGLLIHNNIVHGSHIAIHGYVNGATTHLSINNNTLLGGGIRIEGVSGSITFSEIVNNIIGSPGANIHGILLAGNVTNNMTLRSNIITNMGGGKNAHEIKAGNVDTKIYYSYKKGNEYLAVHDSGTRTVINDVGENGNNDPASAGDWNGHGYDGLMVKWGSAGNYKMSLYKGGAWYDWAIA